MAINENIVTGRKFRKLVDEANKLWQRISFWSKASDVEFDDGSNAETKLGAINGVTDSLTSTASNIAASAAAVKALNDKITELNSNIDTYPDTLLAMSGYSADINVTSFSLQNPNSNKYKRIRYTADSSNNSNSFVRINGTAVQGTGYINIGDSVSVMLRVDDPNKFKYPSCTLYWLT